MAFKFKRKRLLLTDKNKNSKTIGYARASNNEHSNVLEAIEQELNMIAKYHDQIEVLSKYFKKKNDEQ